MQKLAFIFFFLIICIQAQAQKNGNNTLSAKEIIKKTIKSKRKNTDKFANYTANFYSKGVFKATNIPKTILGQELGDLGGGLDSTRSGIVFLSETVSKIKYRKKGRLFNEHIVASKVAGKDYGIYLNQANDVKLNFYENTFLILDTPMVSPLARAAFSYYNYKLAGSFTTEKGIKVYQIKLLPKHKNDRVFEGSIYITDTTWQLYKIEVSATGNQLNLPIIDVVSVKQNFSFHSNINAWIPQNQTIHLQAILFGSKLKGEFLAAYTNYNFSPNFTNSSFSNAVLSFAENATERKIEYNNNPIHLSKKEYNTYAIKDSISKLRNTKQYLDSLDKKSNRYKLFNPIFGYTFKNSYKKWSISMSTPLRELNFNTVQGWHSSLRLAYKKDYNTTGKQLTFDTNFNYGISDQKLRPTANFTYRWNNFSKTTLKISGGISTQQFNPENPVKKIQNTFNSLVAEQNYLKIYEKRFAKIAFSSELANGIDINSSLTYNKRSPLQNNTDFVIFPRSDIEYTSNNPQNPNDFSLAFTPHEMYHFKLGTTINFGQKYLLYPTKKIKRTLQKYPELRLSYQKNFNWKNKNWNSDIVRVQLSQRINLDNWGQFRYLLKAGAFLKKKYIPFIDYAHFNGNRIVMMPSDRYMSSFLRLPYYDFSTNDKYAEFHTEYNFKGAIVSKIPLLNKTKWYLVTSAKGLFTSENEPYSEYSIGFANIGFGKWRFFRIEYTTSYFNDHVEGNITLGIRI